MEPTPVRISTVFTIRLWIVGLLYLKEAYVCIMNYSIASNAPPAAA